MDPEALVVHALPVGVAPLHVGLEGAEQVALVAPRAAVVARPHVRLAQVAPHVARVADGFGAEDAEEAGRALLDLRAQQLLQIATLVFGKQHI